jgi:AraC-like DNA-binding protein
MAHFTLTKSKHLQPFAAVLHQHGVHVHRLLRNANLPPTCLDKPESFISGVSAGQFRDLAAQKIVDPNISLQAARYVEFEGVGNFGRALGLEPTLQGALHRFRQLVATETSNVIIELHSLPNGDLWFSHRVLSPAKEGGWHSNLYVIIWMLKIVRLVDPVWSPAEVSLAAEERRERFEAIEMLGSTARFQKNSTGFLVPASMLALPVTKHPAQGEDIDTDLGSTAPAEICAESIREIVLSYATDGWLSIEQFSEVARTSVRTTQRCLAMEQKTYTDLVQQCRAEMAGNLLGNTDVAIADIANQLGYSSQGNFTRAFYRWAKVSPSAVRKQRSRTH